MGQDLSNNVERFRGFARLYDSARPQSPKKARELILRYLGRRPEMVVDLGCGTGLSTAAWCAESDRVTGVEPGGDMAAVARERLGEYENVSLVCAFSHETGLASASVDVVTCSQSFHWMDPAATLREAARILKDGGVFAAYDCDWPPVSGTAAELAYEALFSRLAELEERYPDIGGGIVRTDKSEHLENIRKSGLFAYCREVVFSNTEPCDAGRLIALALSQGGLQSALGTHPDEIVPALSAYEDAVRAAFGERSFPVEFCYRMRLGVKA